MAPKPAPTPAGVAVPAYAHPAVAPNAWRHLETLDLGGGFVVVNVADGPGDAIDSSYLPVTQSLLHKGSSVCGYVDTDYGRRAPDLVLRDVARYRQWYGVSAVFLDQVAAGADAAAYYQGIVDTVRAGDARLVVLNPGIVPEPAIADLGDILVTFEGTWDEHRRLCTPSWLRQSRSTESVCHLVHSIPRRASVPQVIARASMAGAGIVGISSDGMPNPWSMIGKWVA
jgi:Spherulation-specific family 4